MIVCGRASINLDSFLFAHSFLHGVFQTINYASANDRFSSPGMYRILDSLPEATQDIALLHLRRPNVDPLFLYLKNIKSLRERNPLDKKQPGWLIWLTIPLLCSDPLDKIYALRGLLREEDQSFISVDYKAPCMEKLQEVFVNIWQELHTLKNMFNLNYSRNNISYDLIASWVPDLCQQQ